MRAPSLCLRLLDQSTGGAALRLLKPFLKAYPQNARMLDDEKLQLAGPIGVIAAISSADLGAHALATWPTSSFLWYLNLEVFQAFRYNLDGLGLTPWLGSDGIAQSIWVAVPLFGLICLGLFMKTRLPLAIASNMSLIFSMCLFYDCCSKNESLASPAFDLRGLCGPSVCLSAAILLASFLSSTVSHRSYWREIFS